MASKDLSAKLVGSGKTLRNITIQTQGLYLTVENAEAKKENERGIYDAVGRYLEKRPKNSDVLRMKKGIIVSKRCAKCLEWYDIADFPLRKSGRYIEYCPTCYWEKGQEWGRRNSKRLSERKYRKTRRDKNGELTWKCSRCKRYRYIYEYHKDNHNNCIRSSCKYCYNKQHPKRGLTNERHQR